MAESFKNAAEWVIKELTTSWMNVPVPDLVSADSPAMWLQGVTKYFVMAAAVLSLLIAAGKLAVTADMTHLRSAGQTMARVLITTLTATTFITLGLEIGSMYKTWIIEQTDINLSETVVFTSMVSVPGLLLIMALLMIIIQIVQFGLVLAAQGILVLLAGVLPVLAASSKDSFTKALGWCIAFVLYLPVAATIYALTFKMVGSENDLPTQLSGMFLMILAIVAMPALIKICVPAAGAMSMGNAAGMVLGAAGAAAAVGAIAVTGGAAGFAGAGGAAASGASAGAGGAAASGAGASASGAASTAATSESAAGSGAGATSHGSTGGPSGGLPPTSGASGQSGNESTGSDSSGTQSAGPNSSGIGGGLNLPESTPHSGASGAQMDGENPASPISSPPSSAPTTGGASGAAEADSAGTNFAGYIQAAQTGKHLATEGHNQASGALEDTA
ncbi:hypothetical protein [Paeniglutamicibacter sp. NPDC091659]|uniref:hypothetical protein n=1 Tax=Paeniglutamicibacter sp. NPDC091659 TaxID=3364389 RepID=UPI003821EE49